MDNITKIKLINSLIDSVSYFYDLKQKGEERNYHLKGFCEGLAFGLVQMGVIDKDEADKILQGLGKKRDIEISKDVVEDSENENIDRDKESPKDDELNRSDLDIPTVFRKKELSPDSNLI